MDGNLDEIVHCPPRFWTSIKDELIEIGNSEVCDYPQTIQFKIALAYVITFLQKNCTGNCDAADNRLNVFLDKYATFYMNSDDVSTAAILVWLHKVNCRIFKNSTEILFPEG